MVTNSGRTPWKCPTCGTYYAGVNMPHPLRPGERLVIPPPVQGDCKTCQDRAYKEQLAEQTRKDNERIVRQFLKWSDIGASYLECTLENFKPRSKTRPAVDAARTFIASFGQVEGQWLLLFGGPGAGKTHLGMAIRNEFERQGRLAIASTQPHLLKEIRASWNRRPSESDGDARSEGWMLDRLQTAPFVLLDDLGPWPDWAEDRMYTILDGRYRNRRQTVFTSNYSPDELEEAMGPRLWSRFAGRTLMVPVDATDYRVEVEREKTMDAARKAAGL